MTLESSLQAMKSTLASAVAELKAAKKQNTDLRKSQAPTKPPKKETGTTMLAQPQLPLTQMVMMQPYHLQNMLQLGASNPIIPSPALCNVHLGLLPQRGQHHLKRFGYKHRMENGNMWMHSDCVFRIYLT